MSHTFMVLVITMAAYLPRDSFATLSNVASTLIQRKDDPQLQKKAYKLISRLAGSDTGKELLQERSQDITALLLRNTDKVATPARRDRLQAIGRIIEYLPSSDLHFIPSILKEVIVSVKEVNEKARSAAFELLVAMGEKMKQGGTVVNAKVPHMPPDAPDAAASLEEYFKMVSAGLADTNPHMVSATVTALSRLLFHFRGEFIPSS
jgi:ribosomal RNA-processing protein 12